MLNNDEAVGRGAEIDFLAPELLLWNGMRNMEDGQGDRCEGEAAKRKVGFEGKRS
jgi:hypothetical protein